jgi:hypothetical protein
VKAVSASEFQARIARVQMARALRTPQGPSPLPRRSPSLRDDRGSARSVCHSRTAMIGYIRAGAEFVC